MVYEEYMGRVTKAVNDNLVDLARKELKRIGKKGNIGRKLQAIISAKEHGITKVSKIFGVTRRTLMLWILSLKQGSAAYLYPKPKRTRKPLVSEAQQREIKEWILNNNRITIRELSIRIKEEMGIKVSNSTIHRLIKKT